MEGREDAGAWSTLDDVFAVLLEYLPQRAHPRNHAYARAVTLLEQLNNDLDWNSHTGKGRMGMPQQNTSRWARL